MWLMGMSDVIPYGSGSQMAGQMNNANTRSAHAARTYSQESHQCQAHESANQQVRLNRFPPTPPLQPHGPLGTAVVIVMVIITVVSSSNREGMRNCDESK